MDGWPVQAIVWRVIGLYWINFYSGTMNVAPSGVYIKLGVAGYQKATGINRHGA